MGKGKGRSLRSPTRSSDALSVNCLASASTFSTREVVKKRNRDLQDRVYPQISRVNFLQQFSDDFASISFG